MILVDANVILRYLLDDHSELSAKSAEILELHTVTLPVEVGCEIVYVLQKVYGVDRHEIQKQLTNLLTEGLVNMEKPSTFLEALRCYASTKLDFVDCLLWAYHVVDQQEIITFDQKLENFINQPGESP